MLLSLLRRLTKARYAGYWTLLGLWLLAGSARATHIRAGDIQAKSDTTASRNPLRIFFKMVTYTDATSTADDNNEETIFFGDGTSTANGCTPGGVLRVSRVSIGNNVNRNIYYFEHTYNAPGRYTVAFIGENRATGIRNIPASNTRNFYISTLITIDPVVGVNRSPVLNAPAVDRAAVRQVFLHNPAASDADGDSLAYKLLDCQYEPRGVVGVLCASTNRNRPQPVVLPGYLLPNNQTVSPGGVQVPYPGPPPSTGGPASLTLDERTGQLVWNAPSTVGDYNLAFKVEEWRRTASGARIKIGEVIRDMQITVFATANNRPLIAVPRDTCVVAGTSFSRTIRATDPDNNPIRLSAFGGIFPPATFRQTVNVAGRAEGVFSWTTSCSDVASDPKLVVFKAEDQPTSGPVLIDERPWRITVVGPPPTGLRPVAQGTTVQLTWDRYFCQNASRILIFRKEGNSTWNPADACDVGIPASAGYVQIGAVAANLQSFLDDNGTRGLDRGKTYCYRIYAEFPRPAGGASLASQEACVTLQGRAALFTNVTVDRTAATNGQITVKWTRPASSSGFNLPVGYRLFRNAGAGTPFTLVRTIASLDDTVHVDPNLNTRDLTYSYRLDFFRNGSSAPNAPEVVETAGPASSVRVEATPNPGSQPTIAVRWGYTVPWNNSGNRTRVYRRNPGSTAFVLLSNTATSTRTGGTYLDNDPALRQNATYCYYVETVGGYDSPQQPQDLVNRSQELCVALTQPPCRPVLTLQGPDCDALDAQAKLYPSPLPRPLTFTNNLSWTLSNRPDGCNARIVEYRVLYSPACDSSAFQEVGRTRTTAFAHAGLSSAAGCYRVLAVDSAGATAASNIVRGEDCRLFVLPNIFSPDGDQKNDTFRPIFASPIVRAQVKIFNRWGAMVYSGNAGPNLTLWDGGGARGAESGGRDAGAKAVSGTYHYLIEVEFADANHTRQSYKGWLELMRQP